ncbi:hypothetical protein E4H12_13470, partial [Candidatus Thorarchaeota archaeon]
SADDLYTNEGESFLTDEQYDTLKQYVTASDPSNVYLTGVGSSTRGGKVKLPYKMGSLTQAYQGDMQKWVEKHSLKKEELVVTEKLDGVSVLIVYGEGGKFQIAYSRGDGLDGADVSRHIFKMEGVPTRVASREPMVIRAEVIISKKNFKKVQPLVKSRSGKQYKNARNMMAGVMNASENSEVVYDYIDVVAYEIISTAGMDKSEQLRILYEDNQFIIPNYVTSLGTHLIDNNVTKILNKMREESAYEIDGVVVEVDLANLRKKINPSKDTLNPEYARKYKVADASNLAIATVVSVEWNISKDGYLKPRVRIEPVQLVGVTVQHATGFNAKFIAENGIGPGAKVKITRSGDVIPLILEVVEPASRAQMPTQEAEWTKTGVDLVLKNAQANSTVKFEQLNDFFMSIDAPYLREGNLQKIFDAGFETPESVIELTQQDLGSLLGSPAVGRKVFNGLREKLTNVPMYVLMGSHSALGRGVGVRKMKKLYEAFEGDMTKCAKVPNILMVDGFEQKTASKITMGYPKFEEFLKKIKKYVTIAKYESKKSGSLSGQTFVFTGFRSKELEKTVEEKGGKMGSAVSNKTTYLVAEDKDSTSGKATKARGLGVKVIGVEELNNLLK